MVGQSPNRKGAIESLKGDKSFRNCNLNNWSSWHMLLTCCDTIHSLLIPPFSAHHIHSFLATWCIVTSVFRIMSCLRSFISGSGCSMTRNMNGICSWLTINWFRPSLLSRKYRSLCFIITFVFRVIICVNPSIQEQSVCMTRNMKTWFQMFQPWIHIYKDL